MTRNRLEILLTKTHMGLSKEERSELQSFVADKLLPVVRSASCMENDEDMLAVRKRAGRIFEEFERDGKGKG